MTNRKINRNRDNNDEKIRKNAEGRNKIIITRIKYDGTSPEKKKQKEKDSVKKL